MKKNLVEKALTNERESKYVEFKSDFDLGSTKDWVKIIKEIVAMANTDGGCVLVGVDNKGNPFEYKGDFISDLDSAQMGDKIEKYTGISFENVSIHEVEKEGTPLLALEVKPSEVPLVFSRPGTYPDGEGGQKTAFGKGTVYFRRTSKSEPGDSQDVKDFIEREKKKVRDELLRNINKVVEAPSNSFVKVISPERVPGSGEFSVKYTDDPEKAELQQLNPNVTHPYRQTDLIEAFNERVGDKVINSYDVQSLKNVYKIESKPKYFYEPAHYPSGRYSEEFLQWMIKEYEKDSTFFDKARKKYKKIRQK